MAKTTGRWVVYSRSDDQFVFLCKPLKTRKQAEQERTRLKERPEYSRSPLGVGFVRI